MQLLIGHGIDFDLRKAVFEIAAPQLPLPVAPESQEAVLQFIADRLRSLLLEQGFRYDVVEAVLATQSHNPASAYRAIQELSAWVAFNDWSTILPAYARCVRITRDHEERYAVDPTAFIEPAEKELYAALEHAQSNERRPASVDGLMGIFTPMIPVINRFFETVLVMVEDPAMRANRLGLLQEIAALAEGVADFSKLEGF